jgi:hypothetical protein
MAKDIWNAQNWKDKFFVPFARTGWRPSSLPEQPAKDNFDAETFQKYNPEVSIKIKIYSFFQFLALAYVGLVILESGELNYQELWVTVSMMAFTMYCTSLWLDGKEGFAMEITRLALCIIIGVYSFFDATLGSIAISLLGYTGINILLLPLINRPQIFSKA